MVVPSAMGAANAAVVPRVSAADARTERVRRFMMAPSFRTTNVRVLQLKTYSSRYGLDLASKIFTISDRITEDLLGNRVELSRTMTRVTVVPSRPGVLREENLRTV